MELPGKLNRLFGQKQEEKKLYLAVIFEQARLMVAVVSGKEVNILSHKSAAYSGKLAEATEVLDRLLSDLTAEIPEVEELEETIFGFPPEYVEGDNIKPKIGKQLKELVEQLSLKAKGYVVISEALAYYLSSQSGSQESAVFVGVYDEQLRVSLIKIGKIIDEKTVGRTDNVSFDIATALNSFRQEVLPAKIILYNNARDLSSVKDNLLNFPWEDKANFLHFPKIQILPALTTLKAVVGAYANKGKVVVSQVPIEKSEVVEPEELGFSREEPAKEEPVELKQTEEEPKTEEKPKQRLNLDRLRSLISFLPSFNLQKRYLIILLLVIVAGGILWGLGNLYVSSVQIRILVDTKSFEQDLDFTLDPAVENVDAEKSVIPGKEIAVKLESEASQETQGTSLIGEAASGTVVVYNKTTKEKSFNKDMVLIAGNKLKFTLEKDVKIASASEKIDGLTYGKIDVAVVAAQIGPEGNIEADSELVFEEFDKDDYSARTKEKFTGGTSREVSVVSEEDLVSLRKKIKKSLDKKAKQQIESEAGKDMTVLADTLEGEISKENITPKVGEQAKNATLKATVAYTALAYNQEDIVALLRENAQEDIPEGFVIQEGVGSQKIHNKEVNKDGSVSFSASFATKLLPEINADSIKQEAQGKNVAEFEKYLRGKENIGGFEIIFDRRLPFLTPRTLPNDSAKITVTLTTR